MRGKKTIYINKFNLLIFYYFILYIYFDIISYGLLNKCLKFYKVKLYMIYNAVVFIKMIEKIDCN